MDNWVDGLSITVLGTSDSAGLGFWLAGLPVIADGAGGTGGGGGGGGGFNALLIAP